LFYRLIFSYWSEALKNYGSFRKSRQSLRKLQKLKRSYFGRRKLSKISKVNGKYFWVVGSPSMFSPAMKNFIRFGLNKMIPFDPPYQGIQVIFLGMTRKCPLRCEHCFEGPNLSSRETITSDELIEIVRFFQKSGVAQIQLTGGEPMARYEDIIRILREAQHNTEFWLNTSGYFLDSARAQELRNEGLTGVIVSLDHFDEEKHNTFRKNPRAYGWAINASKSVVKAGMPLTLSICVTKEFITEANLMKYASLGKDLGASFIQLLEPKATGFYKGSDVVISPDHKKVLYDFYDKMNNDPYYQAWPIINYHGFHQERSGCMGAGDRFLYINSLGHIQACPFCDHSFGSVLEVNRNKYLETLKEEGCPA
jgi:MoaA/NifB/PqqE/SkfB family radical SAM enzyme